MRVGADFALTKKEIALEAFFEKMAAIPMKELFGEAAMCRIINILESNFLVFWFFIVFSN